MATELTLRKDDNGRTVSVAVGTRFRIELEENRTAGYAWSRPEFDEKGTVTGYVKDSDGKYVTSRLGEGTLRQIASTTGGEYFHADPKRFGVEEVEAALAGLKRTENEARVVKQYDEVFEVLLLPAFLLLVGEACSTDRRRARAKAREGAAS